MYKCLKAGKIGSRNCRPAPPPRSLSNTGLGDAKDTLGQGRGVPGSALRCAPPWGALRRAPSPGPFIGPWPRGRKEESLPHGCRETVSTSSCGARVDGSRSLGVVETTPALLCDSGSSPLAFLPGEYQSSQGRGYPIPAGLPVGANVNVWYGVPYPRGFCLALVEDFPLGCSGPSFRLVLGARCDLVYALRTCGLGLLGGCLSCLSLYSLH
jgi:hypothetical protein